MAGNILGVDRWTKYIGFAYWNEKSNMVMPIWYLMNDKSLLFNVWDVLSRYQIAQIVVWYPKQHKVTQKKIDEFLKNIEYVDRDIVCTRVDEEYSSVQASAATWTYVKDEKEDTLAAIIILEWYLKNR
jgi:RNase H-fold protein (predicted Holliday junction resolvase)